MNTKFITRNIELKYPNGRWITIRRNPTEHEIKKLGYSSYKMVDYSELTTHNELEIKIYNVSREDLVTVISGGNWDFKEKSPPGTVIDVKVKQADDELKKDINDLVRELSKTYLRQCICYPGIYSTRAKIDYFNHTEEEGTRFVDEFIEQIMQKVKTYDIGKKIEVSNNYPIPVNGEYVFPPEDPVVDETQNIIDEKIIDECSYHLCTKENIEVETCPYCNKHFCPEHITPKVPKQANFRDPKQFDEWKKGDNYHPCPDYYDYLAKKERQHESSLNIGRTPIDRESHRIHQTNSNNEKTHMNSKKSYNNFMSNNKPSPQTENEKEDKKKFISANNRNMSFEKPLPKLEKTMKREKPKQYKRYLSKIHLSNLAKIFYGSLITFLILHLILIFVASKELWMIYIIILCIVEIAGLLWLLFKLDRISTHSTLRLWGLRILAGIIAFFGVFILILLWISSFSYAMFYPLYPKLDPSITFLSFLPYLIPGIGLSGIGAYLEFKFRRESGVIVYRG